VGSDTDPDLPDYDSERDAKGIGPDDTSSNLLTQEQTGTSMGIRFKNIDKRFQQLLEPEAKECLKNAARHIASMWIEKNDGNRLTDVGYIQIADKLVDYANKGDTPNTNNGGEAMQDEGEDENDNRMYLRDVLLQYAQYYLDFGRYSAACNSKKSYVHTNWWTPYKSTLKIMDQLLFECITLEATVNDSGEVEIKLGIRDKKKLATFQFEDIFVKYAKHKQIRHAHIKTLKDSMEKNERAISAFIGRKSSNHDKAREHIQRVHTYDDIY